MPRQARAYWLAGAGRGEIRAEDVPDPGPDDVRVRTIASAVSRGTELLVHRGQVPESERERMRAPFQEGDFPWPVKYGYLNVGVVEEGPEQLVGRTVFALYPHQTEYVVPASAVTPVPSGVPPRRAVLAGTVETAVNALWDAGPLVGDRVAVVGAGLVGCCVARLLSGIPAARVTLVDTEPARRGPATALGVSFASPDAAPDDCDLVLHTSATGSGLQTALRLLPTEGTVVDLSWYGSAPVTLELGSDFHSRRLGVRASQVGAVAPARRGTRTVQQRLALALDLLQDPGFDHLLTGDSAFEELPDLMDAMLRGEAPGLCHTISYPEG